MLKVLRKPCHHEERSDAAISWRTLDVRNEIASHPVLAMTVWLSLRSFGARDRWLR
jgi:hypothetical protein